MADDLVFKIWKATPWSKSKSRRIFHNVKRRLKGNLIPIPKFFSCQTYVNWMPSTKKVIGIDIDLNLDLYNDLTVSYGWWSWNRDVRLYQMLSDLWHEGQGRIGYFRDFTLSSHHNFDLPVTLIWPWPWSDLEQGPGFQLSLIS